MADETEKHGKPGDQSVTRSRRRFLTGSVTVIGAAGFSLAMIPFVET